MNQKGNWQNASIANSNLNVLKWLYYYRFLQLRYTLRLAFTYLTALWRP